MKNDDERVTDANRRPKIVLSFDATGSSPKILNKDTSSLDSLNFDKVEKKLQHKEIPEGVDVNEPTMTIKLYKTKKSNLCLCTWWVHHEDCWWEGIQYYCDA
ncbi:MAG: hypothetical protein ACE5KZ_04350 [Candidatus Scalinduaceae bacterium]